MKITDSNLVFIVSQPRSGSTLLQAILSQSDQIKTTSEHWLLLPFLSIYKPELINAQYDAQLANDALCDFLYKRHTMDQFQKDLSGFLLKQYANNFSGSYKYILDKTPRYYEILDEIMTSFPAAKIIVLKRNPIVVLDSIIKTWKRKDIHELVQRNGRDIFHAPYQLNAFIKKHRKNKQVLTISYEELITTPTSTLERVFDWLEVPFKETYLNYTSQNDFQGKYGDPIGVHNRNRLSSILKTDEETLRNNPNSSILNGYGAYLGEQFLNEYGLYKFHSCYKSTWKFKALELMQWNKDISVLESIKMTLARKFGNL